MISFDSSQWQKLSQNLIYYYRKMKVKETHDLLAKLIIIGDSGVGKTNLILSFVGQPFKDNYVATIGVDFKAKTLTVDDKKIKLQIWDTAGQQRYRTITQTYYKGASAIILTYSIADRESFQNLTNWIHQISQKAPPGVPKIIIGNKNDLQNERTVTQVEGQELANKFSTENSTILFCEVSAKNGTGVQQAFAAISRKVKDQFQREHIIKPPVKIAKPKQAQLAPNKCSC